jgi:single-stranded DNA-binding protein
MAQDGFTFEGQGTLHKVDTFVAKSGKSILTLVLQTQGQYEQFVPIKCFGRLVDEAADFAVGDVLKISGDLGGREWNGKFYGDINARRIDVVSKTKVQAKQEQQPLPSANDSDEPPF